MLDVGYVGEMSKMRATSTWDERDQSYVLEP